MIQKRTQTVPTLKESISELESTDPKNQILTDAIYAVFDNKNMLQRSVLHPKLAKAIIRAKAYGAYFDDPLVTQIANQVLEIVVSFEGKGRKDMREAIASALGIAIRTQASPTDSLLGLKKD